MSSSKHTATAFAPASIGNAAVGFDVLGLAMDQVGDRVTVTRTSNRHEVLVKAISGVVTNLPLDSRKNTAAVALHAMIEKLGLDCGFEVSIDKGIAMGSGMGGSAASAVGAVVAANALLGHPCTQDRLLEFALAGEAAASGSAHADNVAPCLHGGLVLALSIHPLHVIPIPIPTCVHCVLVHPHLLVETRHARAILKPSLSLQEYVHQSANLAAFVSACYRDDLDLLRASMKDVIIEPQRASLIPGFYEAKDAALAEDALGFSISGSGPSVFAWASSMDSAARIAKAINTVFATREIPTDTWVGLAQCPGARVIE
ncbi:MAG TPA: homoserine kinase [Polyangium sp.]|nr:homoserine kinase [Polyangium sp.]